MHHEILDSVLLVLALFHLSVALSLSIILRLLSEKSSRELRLQRFSMEINKSIAYSNSPKHK